MTLSILDEHCQSCEYVNDCDNKRMEACTYMQLKPKNLSATTSESFAMPMAAEMAVKHNYRDLKIAEGAIVTIDLEDVKKQFKRDFYKQLNCQFLGGAV